MRILKWRLVPLDGMKDHDTQLASDEVDVKAVCFTSLADWLTLLLLQNTYMFAYNWQARVYAASSALFNLL